MNKSDATRPKGQEIMQLVDEFRYLSNAGYCCSPKDRIEIDNEIGETRAKLQAFADEYQDLKYCYDPDEVKHGWAPNANIS